MSCRSNKYSYAFLNKRLNVCKAGCSACLQGFPGVLIVVGHFLDSFWWEVNFILWELDSMASYLDRLLVNSYWICSTSVLRSTIRFTLSIFHVKKSQQSVRQLWELLETLYTYFISRCWRSCVDHFYFSLVIWLRKAFKMLIVFNRPIFWGVF